MEPSIQDVINGIQVSLKRAGDVQTGLKGIRRGGILEIVCVLMSGAKRMVGKRGSGASEWRSLLQVLPRVIVANDSFQFMQSGFMTMCEI